jgi:hypothetical protein
MPIPATLKKIRKRKNDCALFCALRSAARALPGYLWSTDPRIKKVWEISTELEFYKKLQRISATTMNVEEFTPEENEVLLKYFLDCEVMLWPKYPGDNPEAIVLDRPTSQKFRQIMIRRCGFPHVDPE